MSSQCWDRSFVHVDRERVLAKQHVNNILLTERPKLGVISSRLKPACIYDTLSVKDFIQTGKKGGVPGVPRTWPFYQCCRDLEGEHGRIHESAMIYVRQNGLITTPIWCVVSKWDLNAAFEEKTASRRLLSSRREWLVPLRQRPGSAYSSV